MASATVDYYFAPNSPWAYLGHERLAALAQDNGATVRVLPMDMGGKVFPVSGGLPLAQRPVQRQAYRLVELARFSHYLGKPLNVKPKFFPVNPDLAARVITAVDHHDGAAVAMKLTGAVMRAVWAEERNIADAQVMAALLAENGVDAARLAQADSEAVRAIYDANTQAAIDLGLFGAPTYVIDGEIFWGQDRLDFVERKLKQGA
jgi:2-hydroxychromene-2-carboxylate isomerase